MAKRRKRSRLLAERTLIEIRQKKRAFLREVGAILSEALGFECRVTLARPDRMAGLSPSQRKFARLSKKDARAQIREAFAPFDEPQ